MLPFLFYWVLFPYRISLHYVMRLLFIIHLLQLLSLNLILVTFWLFLHEGPKAGSYILFLLWLFRMLHSQLPSLVTILFGPYWVDHMPMS